MFPLRRNKIAIVFRGADEQQNIFKFLEFHNMISDDALTELWWFFFKQKLDFRFKIGHHNIFSVKL